MSAVQSLQSKMSLLGLALTFALVVGSVLGQSSCPASAEGCVEREKFNQLSQSDPNYYCEQGAIVAAEAQNCLYRCKFSEQHHYLQEQKDRINTFCKTVDSKCDRVTDTFISQTRCFDVYGGLGNVTAAILREFAAGQEVKCQEFQWARYCQRVQNCSFNERLDIAIVKSEPVILLALAACRSETIKSLLPYIERTDGCKPNQDKQILQKCNVSCDVANAADPKSICALLQKQATCLEEQTAGCTAMARRLVLPRLNTYAVANKHLYCNISYYGLPVRSGRSCEYSDLINTCLLTKTLPNTLNFYQLQPLFNLDTLVIDFCKTKSNVDKAVVACKNAFLACPTLQSLLLQVSSEIDIEFMPEIGVFPLDQFAMKYIYDKQIPDNCPKTLKWSDRICIPIDNKRDVDDEKSTVQSRSTPQGHSTPTRNVRGSTPTRGAGDFGRRTFTQGTTMYRRANTPDHTTTVRPTTPPKHTTPPRKRNEN